MYTWNDYNGNGIQELEEFEIAVFQDQAKYVRIFLPNQIYIKTNQNKFSQSLTLNPLQWQNEKGFKKLLEEFDNQDLIDAGIGIAELATLNFESGITVVGKVKEIVSKATKKLVQID